MARCRRSGRSKTQWLAITFSGTLSTTAESFPVTTETLANQFGPFTVLRTRMTWFARGAAAKVDPAAQFVIGLRKVVLDRTSDSVADIGGTLMDATYLDNENLMWFEAITLQTQQQQLRSDDLVTASQRVMGSGIIDVKAKRRFEDANERLVFDTEAVGVGATEEIVLDVAFRVLLMLH